MEMLRQLKDPSSALMQGAMTCKAMSVEVYKDESVYEQNIAAQAKHNDTSDLNDSRTTNWIELVEQQTVHLRRQTADLVEAEELNRRLTSDLEEKQESSNVIRQALEAREAETVSLRESLDRLSEKLYQAEIDASNWKRAFSNLESQLNEHNALIKKYLGESEARADGLQLEKQKLAAELSEVTEKYMRASQDSYRSVESAGSVGIIPEVLPAPKATRGAPPQAQAPVAPPQSAACFSPPTAPHASSSNAEPLVSHPSATTNSRQTVIGITVNLQLDFEQAFEHHPGGRGGVEMQLKHDLAHASGLAHANFVIQRIESSSSIVDVAIFSNPSGTGPEVLAVAMDLEQQVKDPKSRLKTRPLTCHVQDVAVHSSVHEEYKLTREDNQRLREHVQNLRSQVLKHEGEIEERTKGIQELESQLAEHLRIAKAMQAQVEGSISQLHDSQRSNQEFATRLRWV